MWRRNASRCFRLLGFAVLLSAQTGYADPTLSPTELMARIDAAQKDMRSLRAAFVQHSRVKLFRQQVSSDGRFLYQKGPVPKLRWEYLKPDPSTMLLRGDIVTLKMGTRAPQVIDTSKNPTMQAIFSQLRLWLGQGSLKEAEGEYEVKTAGTKEQPALVLFPKPETVLSRVFTRIELHVDGKTMQLTRLLMQEKNGDEKEVVFGKTEKNIALGSSQFE